MSQLIFSPLFLLILLVILFVSGVKILREYERGVIFRLGRLAKALLNPGGEGNGPGQGQLDDLLAKREEINAKLQLIIDQQTEPWGIKVTAVEVKNVDLPAEMIRAIAKQAEAERERRSKIIHAEGEFQAAQKLSDAADIISRNPTTLQLRFLQTL